jgi:hypothetical protein
MTKTNFWLIVMPLVAIVFVLAMSAFASAQTSQVQGSWHRDVWEGDHSECWLVAFTDPKGRMLSWQLRCVPKARGALT